MLDYELGVRVRVTCTIARMCSHNEVRGSIKGWVGAQTGGYVIEKAAEITGKLNANV